MIINTGIGRRYGFTIKACAEGTDLAPVCLTPAAVFVETCPHR